MPETKEKGEQNYNVVTTIRETWTTVVRASSAAEAKAKFERQEFNDSDQFQNGDRRIIGLRVKRGDDSERPE